MRILAVVFAGAILVLSLEPAGSSQSIPHIDKLMHFLAYGVMAALVSWGWPALKLWQTVLIVTIFGICVELAQGMTNLGRTPSVLDAIANFTGALTSCFVLQLLGQSAHNAKK